MNDDAKRTHLNGPAIAVRGHDIDTDRIIPARFMKCVVFEGLGAAAFEGDQAQGGARGASFDDPRHRGARILLVNRNWLQVVAQARAPGDHALGGNRRSLEIPPRSFAGNCRRSASRVDGRRGGDRAAVARSEVGHRFASTGRSRSRPAISACRSTPEGVRQQLIEKDGTPRASCWRRATPRGDGRACHNFTWQQRPAACDSRRPPRRRDHMTGRRPSRSTHRRRWRDCGEPHHVSPSAGSMIRASARARRSIGRARCRRRTRAPMHEAPEARADHVHVALGHWAARRSDHPRRSSKGLGRTVIRWSRGLLDDPAPGRLALEHPDQHLPIRLG